MTDEGAWDAPPSSPTHLPQLASHLFVSPYTFLSYTTELWQCIHSFITVTGFLAVIDKRLRCSSPGRPPIIRQPGRLMEPSFFLQMVRGVGSKELWPSHSAQLSRLDGIDCPTPRQQGFALLQGAMVTHAALFRMRWHGSRREQS